MRFCREPHRCPYRYILCLPHRRYTLLSPTGIRSESNTRQGVMWGSSLMRRKTWGSMTVRHWRRHTLLCRLPTADCLSGWWFDWWRFWSGICNSSTVPVASDDVLANSKPRKGVLLLVILSYIGVVRTNEKGSNKIKVVTVTVLKLAVNKCMVKLVWSWKFVSKFNMIVVVFSYQGIRDEPGSK